MRIQGGVRMAEWPRLPGPPGLRCGVRASVSMLRGCTIYCRGRCNHSQFHTPRTSYLIPHTCRSHISTDISSVMLHIKYTDDGVSLMLTPAARLARAPPSFATLSLTVTDCLSLGIYTVILLPLLSFSVKLTVSSWARLDLALLGREPREQLGRRTVRHAEARLRAPFRPHSRSATWAQELFYIGIYSGTYFRRDLP
jgi:hypothetical protein